MRVHHFQSRLAFASVLTKLLCWAQVDNHLLDIVSYDMTIGRRGVAVRRILTTTVEASEHRMVIDPGTRCVCCTYSKDVRSAIA